MEKHIASYPSLKIQQKIITSVYSNSYVKNTEKEEKQIPSVLSGYMSRQYL